MKTQQKPKQGRAPKKVVQLSTPPSGKESFPIVGIGASAGGLEAFTQLLQHLPIDTGMAFVLVQHLDPAHESALVSLLARATSMPVREVTNNLVVEPNHVYVIPPNKGMSLHGGTLKLLPRKQISGAFRSIDSFLESLAQDRHDQAIGVILSGTASDGTLGLEAIKAESGITFAQDESAKYDSMPRSAIAAGCVDFILSPEKIAGELARIASHPYLNGGRKPAPASFRDGATPASEAPSGHESGHKKILLLLHNHTGVDFSLYKPTTIERRINRRMVLNRSESLEAYARFLRGNTQELDLLYSDLLINVTSFFRNPEAFDTLKRKVFPRLLQQRREEPVRIWVVGCSSGQEAYSLAMAYLEFCEKIARAPKLQIFATDVNEVMLEKARHGLYAKSLIQDVSDERLRRFFVQEEGGYRITKSLRETCVFARQNLLTDPPFSRMDLVSCRNLLIYIQPGLQQKILPSLLYALKPDGFLFLGASESIGPFTELFEAEDKKFKIFARKAGATPGFRLPVARGYPADRTETAPARILPPGPPNEVNAQREADRLALGRFVPPGVLVNASLQVLQFRGSTVPYLEPPTGKASFELLKMAHKDLLLPLRAALNKAKKQNLLVRAEYLRVGARTVNLEVVPLKNLKERCYLVFFEEAQARRAVPSTPSERKLESRRITELTQELAETRDYLQSIQEQYEAANEELQASNEEVTSANEEIQSINEELETSKEELESTNEELTTVNEEMANRNQELNRLNSDLNNLHVSINTPILLLARDLTIRRFTSQAEKAFNLLATDVGRPLGGIQHNLDFPDLENFITEVIDTVSVREREVQDKNGHWFVLRVRPYLTLDNKIDGAVLMLLDINALKQHEQEISSARDFAQAVIASVPPLLTLEPDLRVRNANESFYQTFGVTAAQTEQRLIYELGNGQWNIPALHKLLEEILPRNSSFTQYEVTHDFETLGRRTMLISGRKVQSIQAIVLFIEDITERKQAEEVLRLNESRLKTLLDLSQQAAGLEEKAIIQLILEEAVRLTRSKIGYFHFVNEDQNTIQLFTWSADVLKTCNAVFETHYPLDKAGVWADCARTKQPVIHNDYPNVPNKQGYPEGHSPIIRHMSLPVVEQGKVRVILGVGNKETNYEEADVQLLSLLTRDSWGIISRKRAEEALRQSADQRRLALESANLGTWDFNLATNEVFFDGRFQAIFGISEAQMQYEKILMAIHPEDQTQVDRAVKQATSSDSSGEYYLEYRVVWPDGTSHWVLANGQAYFEGTGQERRAVRFIGTVMDISERKQFEEVMAGRREELERLVAERTAKLNETIGELEHFSYAITHDMRAPLRAMQGFGQMLLSECTDCLHPEGRDLIRRITESAGRMDSLITDSLQYSKVLGQQFEVKPVDAAALLRSIIESYPQFQLPKAEVQIEANIPQVLGNQAGLTQCFSNLLNNAVKFIHPDTVPKIRVGGEPRGDYVRLWFEDNGIGIAKRHHDQIFVMFQTLSKNYEGTGIGLALVRKVVERMEGKVGVESEEGQGSRFWLELRRAEGLSQPV